MPGIMNEQGRCLLPQKWRALAEQLREMAAEGQARALELAATQLDAWFAEIAEERLSLSDAAERVGRKRATIERAVRDGRVRNLGRKHKPLVSAAEIAARFPPRTVSPSHHNAYDVDADARSLLERRGA